MLISNIYVLTCLNNKYQTKTVMQALYYGISTISTALVPERKLNMLQCVLIMACNPVNNPVL